MKKQNTWIRPLIVIVVTSILSSLTVLYRTSSTTKQLELENESLRSSNDSLNAEIFILNVEIGRHEITRDEILSKYPNVGREYEQYYEHKTE